jgi:hypothetical protein
MGRVIGVARSAMGAQDAELRMLPRLALYRVSGRRAGRSPELYRAWVSSRGVGIRALPGMTSLTERAYFAWHAREIFTGAGEIVDLGAWFGSTTVTLASGLAKNHRSAALGRSVHAYDRFVWEDWMSDYAGLAAFGPYAPGDSFLPEFERVVVPWRDRVKVHAGDLHAEAWHGDPIEILLVDAMKSWSLAEHITATFFGALQTRTAFVIHQDFANAYTPWIHLLAYRLRGQLEVSEDIPRSETVVFRLIRPLDASGLLDFCREGFEAREIERAYEHSLAITDPSKHGGIRASRVMLHIYDHDVEAANHLLERFERRREIDEARARALRSELHRADAATAAP